MPHSRFQPCIDACVTCAQACEHCAAACLKEPDVKMLARCIAIDMDCAATCWLAASIMARGSELSASICKSCAEICEQCAEECAQHSTDHCRACADACRRCAQECRSVGAIGRA